MYIRALQILCIQFVSSAVCITPPTVAPCLLTYLASPSARIRSELVAIKFRSERSSNSYGMMKWSLAGTSGPPNWGIFAALVVGNATLLNATPPVEETAALEKARNKLDSQIVLAIQQVNGLPPFDKPTQLVPDLIKERDGRVLVDIRADVTNALLSHLAGNGIEVISSFPDMRAIRAKVPLAIMVSLTKRDEILFISPAAQATTNSKGESGGPSAAR